MDQSTQDNLNDLEQYVRDITSLDLQLTRIRWSLSNTLLRQHHILTTSPTPSVDELTADEELRNHITRLLVADWFEKNPTITGSILTWLIDLPNFSCEIAPSTGSGPFIQLSLHLSQDHDEARTLNELNQIITMVSLVRDPQKDPIRINITTPGHQGSRSFPLNRSVNLKDIARSTVQQIRTTAGD